ncbi:MAG: TolC family protein [bacterium]|nr:MAG: TolC family protein [bacterium]
MKKTIVILFFLLANVNAQTEQQMTLSLEGAKSYALKNNPHYQIQLKKIDAQKGMYWSEIVPDKPEIGIEVEEVPPNQAYTNYGEKRVFVEQELDFPSNYFFRHKILYAEIQRATIQLEEVKREVFFDVKEAYFNLLLQNEFLTLAEKNLQLSQDFYNKAKRSYELGESDRLIMLKAKVNFGIAQKGVNAVQKDVETGVSKLKEVLGLKDQKIITIVLSDSLPETLVTFSHDLLKQGLQNHPALTMAKLTRKAAANAKHLAYGNFLPQLSFSYFKQEIDKNDFWGAEVGLSFPLWFMGQTGQIQQKRAEQTMADYFYIAEQLRLQKEFDHAIAQLEKAANEVKLFQTELLNEAEEVFRIARQSYTVGEIGYLQFIDAQQTLIQTRDGYLKSLFNYQVEKAHLTKLAGVEL